MQELNDQAAAVKSNHQFAAQREQRARHMLVLRSPLPPLSWPPVRNRVLPAPLSALNANRQRQAAVACLRASQKQARSKYEG